MVSILIFSIFLNIITLGFTFIIYSDYEKLKKENKQLKQRKIKVSDQLFSCFEKVMIKAIESGDIKLYKTYRDMYNDLIPKITSYKF